MGPVSQSLNRNDILISTCRSKRYGNTGSGRRRRYFLIYALPSYNYSGSGDLGRSTTTSSPMSCSCSGGSIPPRLNSERQPIQHIPPCRNRRKLARIIFIHTAWQGLHCLIVINGKEQRNRESLLVCPIHHTVHRTFIYSVRPMHQEIRHIDHDAPFHWRCRYPVSVR